MTVKELAYVVLKLLGLYFLLQAIYLVPLLVQTIASLGEGVELELLLTMSSFLFVVLLVTLGYVLLRRTEWVGRKVGLEEFSDSEGSIQVDRFQTVAFSVVGVFLVGSALPGLARVTAKPLIHSLVVKAAMKKGLPYGVDRWSSYDTGLLVQSLVQLAVGIYLFLQAAGLARLWQRWQERKKLID